MRVVDLLLVTHERATEVDGVIDLCRERGLVVERLNLCQYPEGERYSWTPNGHLGESEGKLAQALTAKSAWFHDPGNFTITRSLDGHGRELALRECRGFWDGVTLSADPCWLNTPAALIASSRKLHQLARAHALQIPIPTTLVSNNPEAVQAFFRNNHGAVAKSIANGYSVYGQEQLKLYSRYYAEPPQALLDGLDFSPLIFQEHIDKQRELRVTIVDSQCFGMVADTTNLCEQNIDIRRVDYNAERGRFSGMTVPEHVAVASRQLLDAFNLSYAGLDWIEDENGRWVFLELNSMGSFKWSELCGAGDITCALADALIKRSSGHS